MEVDGNRSELTVTGELPASAGAAETMGTDAARSHFDRTTLDDMSERLVRTIEAAVARGGTDPDQRAQATCAV